MKKPNSRLQMLLSLCCAATLPCCTLGFDASVPEFDAVAPDAAFDADGDVVADAASDIGVDTETSDAADVLEVTDTTDTDDVDGTITDADATDSEVADTDAGDAADVIDAADLSDTTDATDTSDTADATDSGPDIVEQPVITVVAPESGTFTVGEPLQIEWESTSADTVRLLLVLPDACESGEEDGVVQEIASTDAAAGAWVWEVAVTVEPGEYQIRAVAESVAGQAFDCSEVFALAQPGACAASDCAIQNRACELVAGLPECADCLDGYQLSDGTCVVVDCGDAPVPPTNATLSTLDSTQYRGLVTYACNTGFTTTGVAGGNTQVTRRCGADGLWLSASGVCAPVNCGAIPPVSPDGTLVGVDRTTFGGTARYSCNIGWLANGGPGRDYSVECGANGAWSDAATCQLASCGALPAPSFGSVSTPTGVEYNDVATYACEPGYVLAAGSATRTCGADAVWSGSAAACEPLDCGPAPVIDNGSRTPTGETFGASASYACNTGYTLDGSATLYCGTDGTWGTAPRCNDTNECETTSACNGPGNICNNQTGSFTCSCAAPLLGAVVSGANADCRLPLGAPCTDDTPCEAETWCPTDTSLRFCSPRPALTDGVDVPFQFVPAGAFQMGSPVSELGRVTDENQGLVTLTQNYFVSRTEVTQAQWTALSAGTNPACNQAGNISCNFTANANPQAPVEYLDWYSAVGFANAMSIAEGLTPCYTLIGCDDPSNGWQDGVHAGCTAASFAGVTCPGYRLLTEAEWERAARAGTTSATYLGELQAPANSCDGPQPALESIAWWCGNATRTSPVAGREPNAWGLFDSIGNVAEQVWNWSSSTNQLGIDPTGPTTPTGARGFRGGNWGSTPDALRAADRDGASPTNRNSRIGFRIGRSSTSTTCGALPPPINGQVATPQGAAVGSVATYSCGTGFLRDGDAERTCQASGVWSGAPPACNDI